MMRHLVAGVSRGQYIWTSKLKKMREKKLRREARRLNLVREKQTQFIIIQKNILLVSPSKEIEKSKHGCVFTHA
jgi:hypothetical protein